MPGTTPFPDPTRINPIRLPDGSVHPNTVFLNRVIDHPNFEIGDFTYMSAFDVPEDWAAALAPYIYPGAPDRVRIGRYCQIASDVRFVTASANHKMDGISTFPFPVFSPDRMRGYQPDQRDIVIGHDVWLGYGAMVGPGAQIGNGVIVGAGAVVRGSVPDFAVVVGNPGQVVRMRFDPPTVARLLRLRWWDWPVEAVARAQDALLEADIDALEALAP